MSIPCLLFVLVVSIVGSVNGQIVGVDICFCQPSTVTFRLNFTFVCPQSNVSGPGIIDASCLVETRGNENVTDEVPTTITAIKVSEWDENRAVIAFSTYEEGYVDGAEITYTSIVERAPENITSAALLPRGFQIDLTGLNAAEQSIVNIVAIEYSGECGIFPLLEIGEQIGWVQFTDLGNPVDEFCPATPPLALPTASPSLPPMTQEISDSPSASPSDALPDESDEPTLPPVDGETEAPIATTTAPFCPPIGTNGMVGGMISGGKGKLSKSSTEDSDRRLRTGGGENCPEPVEPDAPMKKKMSKHGDMSTKDDVPQSKQPKTGKNVDTESGQMKDGKGMNSKDTSKGKGGTTSEGKGGKGGKGSTTSEGKGVTGDTTSEGKGGKGKHDEPLETDSPQPAPMKGMMAGKNAKSMTEDEEERSRNLRI